MSTDTKAIIGTIVAAAVSLGGLFGGLLSVQLSGIDARFDDVNARFGDVNARIDGLSSEIAGVRDDVRRIDDRLRAVEIAFGKVDQRLATLERLHLPGNGGG